MSGSLISLLLVSAFGAAAILAISARVGKYCAGHEQSYASSTFDLNSGHNYGDISE